jgi:glucose-6-phosphate 1-epimerase
MSRLSLVELNEKFRLPDHLEFISGPGGFPTARIHNRHAESLISLYGAHVLSYRPKREGEVLWMSSRSAFEEGKAIRGGIPICFPWFGQHPTDSKKPQHGFARLSVWDVLGASIQDGAGIEMRMGLVETAETKNLWPYSFTLQLTIVIGSSLNLELRCVNTGKEPFTYTDALHSYFAVSEIHNIGITGLKGSRYYDGNETMRINFQHGESIRIEKEENRRYLGTTSTCHINDAGFSRTIQVGKTGSRITVVWNPWIETSKKMTDMTEDGYQTMICVEAVNAYDDTVTLEPGAEHVLGTQIKVIRTG